ncbi:acyl-CoA thioesterase [Halotalea alkalilenta]|uniref:4-hydroxybenzoyl-CoA thioesterase n=1 Tax=Halotalea alkalilenta TaxID=376489 RepID=A0A172YCT7_9GAMM|nr:acyl-CoA thioesterase [Halotalea alkalilenta]ANF57047.1 4-hydroxybenzoyl-CoA thioesterase [Halotalea alkalilenta]
MTIDERSLPSAEIELSVAFHDLDPMGVVWHGHYVRYLELARCELLASIGYDYPQMEASGFAWPVIDLSLRYVQPLRYRQRIRVEARLREWEHRLRIDYLLRDADSGRRLTRARSDQVAVRISDGAMQLASPPALVERLLAWQRDSLGTQAP